MRSFYDRGAWIRFFPGSGLEKIKDPDPNLAYSGRRLDSVPAPVNTGSETLMTDI